jgi:hypothetical protein
MNGDSVFNRAGLEFCGFCADKSLSILNEEENVSGRYSRVQNMNLGGTVRVDRSTVV